MSYLFLFALGLSLVGFVLAPRVDVVNDAAGAERSLGEMAAGAGAGVFGSGIAPVFTAEVQYWAPRIVGWAGDYGLDPDLVATVMQIESCGLPDARSGAGAQGLFQVMPFHFAASEDMIDPDTNARRGLNYLVERLDQTNGDVGKALAGYNGGHVAAAGSWESWSGETRRYFEWGTGIYREARSGSATSPTLERWLEAGGASLCTRASAALGL